MKLINPQQDPWHTVGGEDGPMPHPSPVPHLLLTIEQWHAVREGWPAGLPTGVMLPNDVDIETLVADLPRLQLLALQFPKWVDGRAYSQARLLASRHRYAGEVRACGEVLVDMLPLLLRTGFTAARLRADQKLAVAERVLDFAGGLGFAGYYQGDTHQTQPAFARNLADEVGGKAEREIADLYAGQGI